MRQQNTIGYIIAESASEPLGSRVIGHDNGKPIAEGILQDVNHRNRNQRCYAKEDLFPELQCPRTKELIRTGNMKGENGHPQCKDLSRQQTIDPDMVCVKYLDIWTDGDYVKARYTGTNNDRGRDFDADLLAGELPSFSLRALGTIENCRGEAFVRNLKLVTWDRVIYPSHSCAYTEKLVTEGASLSSNEMNKKEILENSNGFIVPITNSKVIEYIKNESANLKFFTNNFDVFYESIDVINNGRAIRMVDKSGNTFVTPIENYIQNEIMNFCSTL